MALVTRTLSNIGSPLYTQDGVLLPNTKITFTLIGKNGVVVDAFDSISQERVLPIDESVYTDINGEFSIELWANSRSTPATYYACAVDFPRVPIIYGVVPEGLADFSWMDFKLSTSSLSVAELNALDIHKQDTNKHISISEKAALSAANALSAENPVATINDIAGNISINPLSLWETFGVGPLVSGALDSEGNFDVTTQNRIDALVALGIPLSAISVAVSTTGALLSALSGLITLNLDNGQLVGELNGPDSSISLFSGAGGLAGILSPVDSGITSIFDNYGLVGILSSSDSGIASVFDNSGLIGILTANDFMIGSIITDGTIISNEAIAAADSLISELSDSGVLIGILATQSSILDSLLDQGQLADAGSLSAESSIIDVILDAATIVGLIVPASATVSELSDIAQLIGMLQPDSGITSSTYDDGTLIGVLSPNGSLVSELGDSAQLVGFLVTSDSTISHVLNVASLVGVISPNGSLISELEDSGQLVGIISPNGSLISAIGDTGQLVGVLSSAAAVISSTLESGTLVASASAPASAPEITFTAGAGMATVEWGSVESATSYDLYYSRYSSLTTTYFIGSNMTPYDEPPNAIDGKFEDITGTSKIINGLTPGQVYYVRMLAKNAIGNGPLSSVITLSGTITATPTLDATSCTVSSTLDDGSLSSASQSISADSCVISSTLSTAQPLGELVANSSLMESELSSGSISSDIQADSLIIQSTMSQGVIYVPAAFGNGSDFESGANDWAIIGGVGTHDVSTVDPLEGVSSLRFEGISDQNNTDLYDPVYYQVFASKSIANLGTGTISFKLRTNSTTNPDITKAYILLDGSIALGHINIISNTVQTVSYNNTLYTGEHIVACVLVVAGWGAGDEFDEPLGYENPNIVQIDEIVVP